jgi:hypothetical protein
MSSGRNLVSENSLHRKLSSEKASSSSSVNRGNETISTPSAPSESGGYARVLEV